MGRVRNAVEDCEYFMIVGVLSFVLCLCVSAWMIGVNIIDEMNEFTEKTRSDLEEFQIIADDVSEKIHNLTMSSIGNIGTDFELSHKKTFNALLRLHSYERKRRYCYRKPCHS